MYKKIENLKKMGKKIVFTNGCFDIIHPGHIEVLKEAKKLGDVLIVGLNSDSSIKKLKGPERPVMPLSARKKILEAIKYVDYVIVFNEKTPYRVIKKIKPDVLVKGADYKKNEIAGREFSKKVITVKLLKGYSTTKIINRIANL